MKSLKIEKKRLTKFLLIVLIIPTSLLAQISTGIGFKGGLNYNANGDYFESISANAQHPDRNIGYHFGLFGKIGHKVYFKPELIYTNTKSAYNDDRFIMQKIDAPMLIGLKVLGPISVFGGPAMQYILDSEFEGISINNVEQEFSVGLNFGIGLNFKTVGLDVRYERGLNNNEATFLDNNNIGTSRLDTRPDQLIVSLSLLL